MGKCTTCNDQVEDGEKYLVCDLCKNHVHASCENIDAKKLTKILAVKDDVLWLCCKCKEKDPLNMLKIIPELLQSQQRLSQEIEALKSKVDALSAVPKQSAPSAQSGERIFDTFKELEMRQLKANNVVIVGLSGTSDNLKATVSEFTQKNLDINVQEMLSSVYKTKGTNPILIAKFTTKSTRDRVLLEARKLRSSKHPEARKVYFNPVLTPFQRSELKTLREELKRRRASGEQVILKGSSIVPLRNY